MNQIGWGDGKREEENCSNVRQMIHESVAESCFGINLLLNLVTYVYSCVGVYVNYSFGYARVLKIGHHKNNMTENFQSKSARTLYIYINMCTA